MSRQRIHRWSTALAGTVALTALGLLYANATLLAAAVIPLCYVLYGSLSRAPEPALALERSVGNGSPAPGERVPVSLTVRNEGDAVLSDLRVVDQVPPELGVVEATPRGCVALPPGDEETITYTVIAKRGEYAFGDPLVRIRSLAGTEQVTTTEAVTGETHLTCTNAVREAPVDDATIARAGTLPTDSGGPGLEFYATREYRHGDPASRVDWRHVAKTGEFVTIQYREEQASRTVIVVDARAICRVTPRAGYPTGAELCAYAGERLHDALTGAGVVTGVTAVGLDHGDVDGLVGPDGLPWVEPDAESGNGHAKAVFRGVQDIGKKKPDRLSVVPPQRAQVQTDGGPERNTESGDGTASLSFLQSGNGESDTIDHLLARLPPNAQVVLCSPLLDNWPLELDQQLAVRNYPRVVVSPDIASDRTTGQRLGRLHHEFRLQTLEQRGARTVSWDIDEPIDAALRQSLPHLLGNK